MHCVSREIFANIAAMFSGDLFVIDSDVGDAHRELKTLPWKHKGQVMQTLFPAKLFWFVGVKEKVFI